MIEQPEVNATGTGAVASGRDNLGIIATGLGAQIHQVINYSERPPVSWPHRVGVVPPVAAGYLPRTDFAVDLERVFGVASGTAVLTGVVSGMGGVGKTQLAAAYAHRLWDAHQLDLLMWLTATSRDAIVTGYAQAGADVASPPAGEDTEQVAARFLAWLAETDKRWLVVLDGLTDPADLKGLWPEGRTGRVLVTTRRRDVALADRGTVVDVDLFTPDEAIAFLNGRMDPDGQHDERLEQAGELAEDLGRLPLALAQAAAYMRDRDLTCAAYRRRLAQRRLELALPPDAAAGDYAGTVATTWSLSIELADRLAPAGLARRLLTLAAQLDPHGIPTGLFTSNAVRSHLAALKEKRVLRRANSSTAEVPVDEVEDALSNLHRLSLITLVSSEGGKGGGGGAVRLHALVQRAAREQAHPAEVNAAAHTAAAALIQVWPEQDYEPRHALLAQSLRDNTDALVATSPGPLWTPDEHPVLFRAGRSRSAGGLFGQAVAYWTTLLVTAEQVLGPDHPDTLANRSNLGLAYQDAGCPAKALALLKPALADAERLLGPGNPESLAIQSVLALACEDAGRPAEALTLLERALADAERILGPDDLECLDIRNNLAVAYQNAGRPADALALLEHTLPDRERLLGLQHPDTLDSRHNLAVAYRDVGRLAEAVALLERTLADTERLLGPEHPDTLASRHNLAIAYRDAGQRDEAVALFERTLADRERILGPEHPDTLTSRGNLASAYREAGRLDEALPLFQRTVIDSERVLGAVHPLLAAALYRLGQVQAELGDLASAAAALGRAVEVDATAYGVYHPKVAIKLNALAAVQERQGNAEAAAASRAQARRIREQQQALGSAGS
ncbi:FxSxx-COOH system tetratricopeptide repeat protein [Geodermatophilus sp. SYSU D01105]